MSAYRRAKVTRVKAWGEGISEASLEFDGTEGRPGLVLEELIGPVEPGNEVIVNVTAVELALGTGGYHFVLWNLSRDRLDTGAPGHIMKLRYTPLQTNCEAIEEKLGMMEDLGGILQEMPVIAGSVHSQLLPAVLAFRSVRPSARIVYVMTDGACLPIRFSNTVRFMKGEGLISSTVTCGHAFGGDFEAVNVFGALAAARRECSADAAVVVMGPGVVGTGSSLGYSGIEQGVVINAAASLGGRPVAIARIAFADERERHTGLSHHTTTALTIASRAPALLPIPLMEPDRMARVMEQVASSGLREKGHQVVEVDARGVPDLIKSCGFRLTTMGGRTVEEEPEYFMAAGAAGLAAARLEGGNDGR